ncbi:hypothetical protein FRC02_001037 [Tulasnella sp. 418]|nr:hypothetical protein FRC02_001037 [Tulasnella sp. 418]
MVGTSNDLKPLPATSNEPVSLEQYNQNRHELLEILSGLHSLGAIADELPLPQIAVVGSQSVGKSSLIESMSGITLPRDSGTCTRCPMECRLEKAPTWSCKVTLRFRVDELNRPLNVHSDHPFGDTIYDKQEVEDRLRQAQRAILRPGTDINSFLTNADLNIPGESQSFSNNCVCIRVAGPDVPDLYFYDLPGIIANVGDGGNERDIKLVEELAKSYIAKPDCLILLVISCETDFENQGAGRLVLKDKNLRQRTIGVLTKVDRIEGGTSTKWEQMLKNEETSLKHGWFAVKQPTPNQLRSRISWEDARRSEKDFFQITHPWSSLDPKYQKCMGSDNLSEHLSLTLSEMTARKLPNIRAKIDSLLRHTIEELDTIPERDLTDPRKQIIKLITSFSRMVSKHIEGHPPDSLSAPSALISMLNQHYHDFRLQIHRTAPQFRPWESTVRFSGSTEREMIRMAESDDAVSGNGPIIFVDQVCSYGERSRTREWPGNYPFSVKENLVRESTQRWELHAKACFKIVESTLTEHLNKLIHDHFSHEANSSLMAAVRVIVSQQLGACAESAKARIKVTCQGELEKYFTQNEHYFFAFRDKLFTRYKSLFRRSRGQQSFIESLKTLTKTPQPMTSPSVRVSDRYVEAETDMAPSFNEDIHTVIGILARRGLHGLGAEDLAKLLPSSDMDVGLEIMAEVRAYFQVAYKRFGDSIPIDIDTGFIRMFDAGLEVALLTLMDLDVSKCLLYLEEPPITVQRRGELQLTRGKLEMAQRKLDQSGLSQLRLEELDLNDPTEVPDQHQEEIGEDIREERPLDNEKSYPMSSVPQRELMSWEIPVRSEHIPDAIVTHYESPRAYDTSIDRISFH